MKIIVLHNIISNEPIVIRADAITAVSKMIYETENSREEHSTVFFATHGFDVKETIGVVMQKIKDAKEV